MSRPRPFHLVAFAAITIMAGCGGGDGNGNGTITPPTQPNQAPRAVGNLGELELALRAEVIHDVSNNFSDPDGDRLSFTATSSDPGIAGAQASDANITITGVAPGTATITVTARDPGGLTASLPLGVSVNGPPVLTDSIPDHVLAEGASATVDLDDHFTDPDDDVASYEAESSDASVASVSVEGSTATITGVSAGTATVTFTVRDEFGQEGTQEVGVTVEEANQAPRATDSIPAQELMPDGEVTLDLSGHFTDPDDDALTYEGETSDADVATVMVDGSNATITGVAGGTATITFTASDPDGLSADQEAMVTVNTAPMPEGTIDEITLRVDASTTLVVSGYFSDADGDALSYEATSSDDDIATTSAADSTLTINGHAAGTATLTITATDPRGASAMQEATVAVKTPPMPDSVPPTHDMVVGNHVELDFSTFFTDEDGDELTYTAVTSDAAVATASVDGSVVTTTAAGEIDDSVGTVVTLTVTATDPAGLSAEQEAMVRVSAAEYDTLVGMTVTEDGTIEASLGGTTLALTFCLPLKSFPFGNQFITAHWTEWQLAAGTGWVTAPRTRRTSEDEQQLCPVKDWEDRQAGTYRLVGNMTFVTVDTTDTGVPDTSDTLSVVTSTLRSPTFTNKPGSSPAQDAAFSSLPSGLLDTAQPSRASHRSLALPGSRFRPPAAAEARAASRVVQVRASAPATLRPPAFTRSRGIVYRQRPLRGWLRKPA
ncbi:MAG: Ig-like domain-containing protein [Gemmatimonadota bacterium]|nr:Ig-like domain-containing protein [Gemmatimonadota bacterium]